LIADKPINLIRKAKLAVIDLYPGFSSQQVGSNI